MDTATSPWKPLATIKDVEALERVPLEQRIFSWNLNDWIKRGCTLDPEKVALHYIDRKSTRLNSSHSQ